ncbi:unnamed protein product, partial [Ixodes persulcatus]
RPARGTPPPWQRGGSGAALEKKLPGPSGSRCRGPRPASPASQEPCRRTSCRRRTSSHDGPYHIGRFHLFRPKPSGRCRPAAPSASPDFQRHHGRGGPKGTTQLRYRGGGTPRQHPRVADHPRPSRKPGVEEGEVWEGGGEEGAGGTRHGGPSGVRDQREPERPQRSKP